ACARRLESFDWWSNAGCDVHVCRTRDDSCLKPELRAACTAAAATTAAAAATTTAAASRCAGCTGSDRHGCDHRPDLLRLRQVEHQTGCGSDATTQAPVAQRKHRNADSHRG